MIATALYNRTCNICQVITNTATRMFVATCKIVERIGTARAAASLASMGYHAEAKNLMLGNNK
jgi:hypothetical protein